MSETGSEHDDLQIKIEGFSPGPEAIDEVSHAALDHPSVRGRLGEARQRMRSFTHDLDEEEAGHIVGPSRRPANGKEVIRRSAIDPLVLLPLIYAGDTESKEATFCPCSRKISRRPRSTSTS